MSISADTGFRRGRFAAVAAAVMLTAAGAALATQEGAGAGVELNAPCGRGELAARFGAVYGSAGAGNIVYALQLRNRSQSTCFVTGLAGLRLRDRAGHALPTQVVAANRGALTAVLVRLRPGMSAWASARFSPDVPGPGEQVRGRCEPVATSVLVTVPPSGAQVVAPVVPPTAVCSHGHISLSALSPVRPTA